METKTGSKKSAFAELVVLYKKFKFLRRLITFYDGFTWKCRAGRLISFFKAAETF